MECVSTVKVRNRYRSFPYTTPGALFRKSVLLDRDFLNSAPGMYTENSGTPINFLVELLNFTISSYLACTCTSGYKYQLSLLLLRVVLGTLLTSFEKYWMDRKHKTPNFLKKYYGRNSTSLEYFHLQTYSVRPFLLPWHHSHCKFMANR